MSCCRMPARQCARRAAAWLLLLRLACFATGDANADLVPGQSSLYRYQSPSSRGVLPDLSGAGGPVGGSDEGQERPDVSVQGAPPRPAVSQRSWHGSREELELDDRGLILADKNQSSADVRRITVSRRFLAEAGLGPSDMTLAPTPSPCECPPDLCHMMIVPLRQAHSCDTKRGAVQCVSNYPPNESKHA